MGTDGLFDTLLLRFFVVEFCCGAVEGGGFVFFGGPDGGRAEGADAVDGADGDGVGQGTFQIGVGVGGREDLGGPEAVGGTGLPDPPGGGFADAGLPFGVRGFGGDG